MNTIHFSFGHFNFQGQFKNHYSAFWNHFEFQLSFYDIYYELCPNWGDDEDNENGNTLESISQNQKEDKKKRKNDEEENVMMIIRQPDLVPRCAHIAPIRLGKLTEVNSAPVDHHDQEKVNDYMTLAETTL